MYRAHPHQHCKISCHFRREWNIRLLRSRGRVRKEGCVPTINSILKRMSAKTMTSMTPNANLRARNNLTVVRPQTHAPLQELCTNRSGLENGGDRIPWTKVLRFWDVIQVQWVVNLRKRAQRIRSKILSRITFHVLEVLGIKAGRIQTCSDLFGLGLKLERSGLLALIGKR